jgi:hypothetical protein
MPSSGDVTATHGRTRPSPRPRSPHLDRLELIPRSFPPAPGWSVDGHRVKAELDYSRGPEKTWVFGALRPLDGQVVGQTRDFLAFFDNGRPAELRVTLRWIDDAGPQVEPRTLGTFGSNA